MKLKKKFYSVFFFITLSSLGFFAYIASSQIKDSSNRFNAIRKHNVEILMDDSITIQKAKMEYIKSHHKAPENIGVLVNEKKLDGLIYSKLDEGKLIIPDTLSEESMPYEDPEYIKNHKDKWEINEDGEITLVITKINVGSMLEKEFLCDYVIKFSKGKLACNYDETTKNATIKLLEN